MENTFALNSSRLTAALRKFYAVKMFCSECGHASLNDSDFVIYGDVRRCARYFECARRKDVNDIEVWGVIANTRTASTEGVHS